MNDLAGNRVGIVGAAVHHKLIVARGKLMGIGNDKLGRDLTEKIGVVNASIDGVGVVLLVGNAQAVAGSGGIELLGGRIVGAQGQDELGVRIGHLLNRVGVHNARARIAGGRRLLGQKDSMGAGNGGVPVPAIEVERGLAGLCGSRVVVGGGNQRAHTHLEALGVHRAGLVEGELVTIRAAVAISVIEGGVGPHVVLGEVGDAVAV